MRFILAHGKCRRKLTRLIAFSKVVKRDYFHHSCDYLENLLVMDNFASECWAITDRLLLYAPLYVM